MDELAPAYVALIRHVLGVPPGSDALVELRTRLEPADRSQRPPHRAPGIARLRRALRRLEAGKPPGSTLEEFREDLLFLKLFGPDEPALAHDAMQRLLADVIGSPPVTKKPGRRTAKTPEASADAPTVVPFRRRGTKKEGGS